MEILIGLIVSYISIVISDFIVHRRIMHGQWKLVKNKHPFIQMWLYPHFIQHIKAHHVHSERAKEKLLAGEKVPKDMHQAIEQKYSSHYWAHLSLICSEHGISIKDIVCLTSFVSLFLLTPHYIVSLLLWVFMGKTAGLISFSMVLFPALNHVIHPYYHMNKAARELKCPWYLKWYVLNKEFDIVASQHKLHHYNEKFKNDYFNLLPFGRLLLRPLYGIN